MLVMVVGFRRSRGVPRWLWVLLIGAGLWLLVAGVAIATGNLIIAPEALLLGGFVVPAALLFWVLGQVGQGDARLPRTELDAPRVVAAFALGGGLGLVGSALIEDYWTSAWPRVFFFDVAVTEEVLKFLAVWILALPLGAYLRRDGMLLGAAVGLGFSAFESTGYAFNALVSARVLSPEVLTLQAMRGLLTPVGHGLWTALVGGALFAAARGGRRLRMTWSVAGWLVLVCALHAAWDTSRGVAATVIVLSGGGGGAEVSRDLLLGTGYRAMVAAHGPAIEVLSGVVQVIVGVIGVALFVWSWRLARSPGPPPPSAAQGSGRSDRRGIDADDPLPGREH